MVRRVVIAQQMIERFCLYLKDEGKAPLTIKNYRCDIEAYVRWAELRKNGEFNSKDLGPEKLKQYREWIIHSLKAGSTNRKLAALRGLLRWAAGSGFLLKTVDVSKLGNVEFERTERPRPQWLDSTEQARLHRAVESSGITEDIAAIKLLLYAGIRASELCELRWTAVRISGYEGALVFKRPKFIRETIIRLPVDALSALISLEYDLHAGQDQLVFTGRSGPMTVRGIDMLTDRYARIARIKKNVTPGTLRNSFCMNLVDDNMSPFIIAELMGIRSVEMLRRFYGPLPGMKRRSQR